MSYICGIYVTYAVAYVTETKYTCPLYKSARINRKLCFYLGDLSPVLPEVCTMHKHTLDVFFILKAISNTRNLEPANSVGPAAEQQLPITLL